MSWDLISLPVVAALIGWGTNVIAIRMLFWPRKPINILGWQFLGVLPKRKLELARSIAEVLNDEILPMDELLAAANTPAVREKVAGLITDGLVDRLRRFIPRFILEHTEEKLRLTLEGLVASELETMFSQLAQNLSRELQQSQLLGQLVEERINSLDLLQLEKLVLRVAKHELRYIELFGAVLGLIIGFVQILLIRLF
ncbi:MAG: DUF445 domain-containing protein [Limnochordia bacterium]|jgi:uncharacterized membrane protein YheB (UPF0754 family)|nr:DUF445 family protein [Bacillota bacterium]NLL08859.1 DUF445 family protein [Bacillota bacterium]HBG09762.1 hypothetical protein [Bacillota bacterium]